MRKCILFSRVSTQKQTLEQQNDELYREAQRQGYKTEDCILLQNKESAIKLDEEERIGLQDLKTRIINDPGIDCVITYEASRISRRPKVLYSIRDFLLERKIQLIILKPYMFLLDPDGSLSQTANILFSVFSALSESEMMLKQERMLRGKLRKKHDGKFTGGHIAFGYTTDGSGRIVINEDEAKTVRLIYDLYEKDGSLFTVTDEIAELGLITAPSKTALMGKITKILCTGYYAGLPYEKNKHIYPAIVSPEQFGRCRQRAVNSRKNHTRTKMKYLCRGIVKFLFEGGWYSGTPVLSQSCYQTQKRFARGCRSVNMDLMDSLALYAADCSLKRNGSDTESQKELKQKIKSHLIKEQRALIEMNKVREKMERTERRYIDGRISEEAADRFNKEFRQKLAELKKFADICRFEAAKLSNMRKKTTAVDIYKVDDDWKYRIIHEHINRINVVSGTKKGYCDAEIVYADGNIENYSINTWKKAIRKSDGSLLNIKLSERISNYKKQVL